MSWGVSPRVYPVWGFFSSYGGILELRRGIQDASCVGPGKSNLPFELRRKAGHCSRVTAGPIDLIQACVQKPMFLSGGDRDLGVAFQTHPGRQAFILSGSKEPRSALEKKRLKEIFSISGIKLEDVLSCLSGSMYVSV